MSQILEHTRIGTIHTPFSSPEYAPRQTIEARGVHGQVELLDKFVAGLDDLVGFSHAYLLYHMHLVTEWNLRVMPSTGRESRGVFATRSPRRPNPIGLSLVRLDKIDGSVLHIRDVDMVDGTPLLDIKPYVPALDSRRQVKIGWLEHLFTDHSEGGRMW